MLTSHELAYKLLATPNVPVVVADSQYRALTEEIDILYTNLVRDDDEEDEDYKDFSNGLIPAHPDFEHYDYVSKKISDKYTSIVILF